MDLQLTASYSVEGDARTVALRDFPVRIGRDDDCELQLSFGFVSRHHARIERLEDGLVLIDEGSRNGVLLDGVRVPPRVPVALGAGVEMQIDQLEVRLQVRELTQLLGADMRTADDPATALYGSELVPEAFTRVGAAMEELRAARVAAHEALRMCLDSSAAHHRGALFARLATHYPELAVEPAFRETAAAQGISLPPTASDVALVALTGLHRLARVHAPGTPAPRTVGEMDGLLGCVDKALHVLTAALARLEPDNPQEPDAIADAAKLRRALLDWSHGSKSGVGLVQRKAEHIEASRTTLRAEVGACVNVILGELSPAAVEWNVRKERWRGPFWTRRLWKEYKKRHERIAGALFERRATTAAKRPEVSSAVASVLPEHAGLQDTARPLGGAENEQTTDWPFVSSP